MHARAIVQRFIETDLMRMHAARRRVLCAVVGAAIHGQCLSLTPLRRGLLQGGLKAAIKRVDRLIGHARIEQEAQIVGAALLARMCCRRSPLVIAVDWSTVSIGGTVPLLLKRMGVDPAVASSPILTTVTDMCGFFLVLSLATLMLPRLAGAWRARPPPFTVRSSGRAGSSADLTVTMRVG